MSFIKTGSKKGKIKCGGPATIKSCGKESSVRIGNTNHKGLLEIQVFEDLESDGWTSDYPSPWTMMYGCSHLCPSCSSE
jgi:hypothetical protein